MAQKPKEFPIFPLDIVETTTITMQEYKELLIIKGKYEELKNKQQDIVNILIDKFSEGKITINQIREILGLKSIKYHPKNSKKYPH